MSDNQPFAVSLLMREALIQGTVTKEISSAFFTAIHDIAPEFVSFPVDISSATLTPIGSYSYPVTRFKWWRETHHSLMMDILAVLPGDNNAIATMKKVWKEPKDPWAVTIYTGPYTITGQKSATGETMGGDKNPYVLVMNAKVSCILPQNHFTDMTVPCLVVNSYLTHIGIE